MKALLSFIAAVAALAETATVIVVPSDLVPAAKQAATRFDAAGGTNTFLAEVVSAGTTNVWGCWAATSFSATNRAALTYMASQPPFATNGVTRLLIMDYDRAADPGAPQLFLGTNGLAVYSPPLN